MHHLSSLAVRRPVAVTVIILIILLFGVISVQRIGIDLLPDMNFPVAVVVTAYPNAPSEMIQQEVTIPIEGALASVSGIRRVDSFSMENVSAIIIQWDWKTEMLEALDEVRSKLAQVAFNLPSDAQDPIVARIDPNEFPLMMVGVSGDGLSPLELSDTLRSVRPRIEQISGVAEVGLLGSREGEIEVLFDPERLTELELNPTLLEQLITYQNMIVPGGYLDEDGNRYSTRTGYRIESLDDLGDLIIGQRQGEGILGLGGLIPSLIYLSDVADISMGEKDVEGITRFNGDDTVLLRVMRQSGANTVQVANAINRELRAIETEYPNLSFTPIIDQSRFIQYSISSLAINGLIGALLALAVLYLFLRNMQSLLVIGIAIPISIISSFIMVYFGNLSLNMMTLGGLALGAGMLVDSSIVVLENIYRHRFEGKDSLTAAEAGSSEIASAIIASTTTTLAVFLPVIYMQSIAGELFKELGLTVSFSLLASLLVALTVVPVLSSKLLRVNDQPKTGEGGPTISRLQNAYARALEWALTNSSKVIGMIVIAVIATALIIPHLGDEFLPEFDEGFISAEAILPGGIPIQETRRLLIDFEQALMELPEVAAVSIQSGDQGDTDILTQIYGANLYNADIQITLTPQSERRRSVKEVSDEIHQIAQDHGIPRLTTMETSLFGSSASILAPSLLVEIRGEDPAVLKEISYEIMDGLNEVPGFRTIQNSELHTVNDLLLKVDPAKGILGGLTAGQIGLAVQQSTTGIRATDLYVDGRSLPVVLRPNNHGNTLSGLLETSVTSPVPINGFGNDPIRLDRVVETQIEPAPPSIQRTNRMRVINVTAQLGEIDLSTASREAREIISTLELPPGYQIEIGGLQQLVEESIGDLYLAAALAIILVYLVMAAQFESFIHPLIVMCTVPLAFIGAVVAMWLTGTKIGVTSLIGMIILAGIVVNNAIVLVDYINLQRRRGFATREAIIKASRVRLRPILMTATTTVLGMIPLALGIGEGGELQAPLAIAVIGGLLTSTVLTLFVVPIMYSIISKLTKGHVARNLVAATVDDDI